MLDNALLTPKELHSDLVFLQSRGFESSDLSRLHHLSRAGRTISLAQLISYFERRRALRGPNVELAVRCHYVAEKVRAGSKNVRPLISEALAKWPLKRASRTEKKPKKAATSANARKTRTAASATRLRSAAKRPKKR